ncbi:MAG: ABC transporter permease [Bacteroidia bacterium]|nr:ABC transporter permease [Bacteroidia bacterium]
MNWPYFIARHLSAKEQKSFSKTIIRLAIVSVALSASVMIIALATVSGFQNGIKEKVIGANGHIIVDDISNVEGSVPLPLSTEFETHKTALQGIQNVQGVYTCLLRPCIAKGTTEIEGMVAKGVDADYDFGYYARQLVEGSIPDLHKDSNQVLVSQTTASRLGLKVGGRFRALFFKTDTAGNQMIKAMNPVITGIFNTGLEEFDKTYFITSRKSLNRMMDKGFSFTQFEIVLKNYNQADAAAYEAVQKLPPGKFNVSTAKRYSRQIFDWLGLLDTNVVIILVLMILVACINMSTTLLIMITERTHMVGTLKALCARNRSISWVFLYQAIFIAIVGLIIGNIVGLGFCYLQQKYSFLKLNVETYYVNHVLVEVEPWHVPVVNLGTLIICILVLFLPTLLINRMTPVKSMKFQ